MLTGGRRVASSSSGTGDGVRYVRRPPARDWSGTALGPRAAWSGYLRAYVATAEHKPDAEAVFWGPAQVGVCNAEYARLLGRWAERLDLSADGDHGETYPGLASAHARVLRTAEPFVHNRRVLVDRGAGPEEGFFTFRGSPLFDGEGNVAGVLQCVVDDTTQVQEARRAVTLSILSSAPHSLADIPDVVAYAVRANPADVPFALLYLREAPGATDGQRARLRVAAAIGTGDAEPDRAVFDALAERSLASEWPVAAYDIEAAFTPAHRGISGQPTRRAFAHPLRRAASDAACGVIVLGVSPIVRMDEAYAGYFEAVAERVAELWTTRQQVAVEKGSRAAAEQARGAAELANRAKDDFLAVLGHELRGPLSPIVTATQLMKLQDPAAFKREREVIERQTGHLAALLDDLSDVSRFTRGRVELQREPLEVREVIDNAIETAGPLLARYQHRVEVKVPDRGMAVDADRTRLRQVFSNLITNAAKYAAPHGRIQIEAERTRDRVVVTVRDDGPGIPDDVAAHIFEPFVQGQRSLGQSLGGLGLGLAIVHNLVTLHGGTVSARTPASGKGTEFVVSLPGQLRPSGVVPRNPVAGRRVLVMDADGDAAAWMARLLEAMGHTTALASDAAAAIERAYDFHPDLAILAVDQGAVDGAGLTLAGRFRGDARLRGVHLVAMIAAGDGARVSFADFDAELSKPVDVTRLASILRSDPGGSSVSADGATRR